MCWFYTDLLILLGGLQLSRLLELLPAGPGVVVVVRDEITFPFSRLLLLLSSEPPPVYRKRIIHEVL